MSGNHNASQSFTTAEAAIKSGVPLNVMISVYRAYLWVTLLRARHLELRATNGEWLTKARENGESGSYEQGAEGELYTSLWHSMLYTLIETWRGHKLSSLSIDALIADPRVNVLRDFRNSTLHPRDYADPRIRQLTSQGEMGYDFYVELLEEFAKYFDFMVHKDRESRKGFLAGT